MSITKKIARARRTFVRTLSPPPPVFDDTYRGLGDAARDEHHWTTAASHYGVHLERNPSDFDIWVQYGHALKETGRLAEAEHAYRRGLVLRPRDADLLLHFGHIRKMRDDPAAAAKAYGQSAQLRPGRAAFIELASPDLRKCLTEEHAALLDLHVGRALAPRFDGATVVNQRDIVFDHDDIFETVSGDGWIHLRLADSVRDADMLEIELQMRPEAADRPFHGQLFVDYGDGFSADHGLDFLPAPDGRNVFRLFAPRRVRGLRLDPDSHPNRVRLDRFTCRPIASATDWLDAFAREHGLPSMHDGAVTELVRRVTDPDMTSTEALALTRELSSGTLADDLRYAVWLKRWITPQAGDYDVMRSMIEAMTLRPRFSFVVPTYNTDPEMLAACIDSMLAQVWPDFEICIADDHSTKPAVWATLQRYARLDKRIKIVRRPHNGHISAASNSALALATGDFVVLVDHDDLVPDYALFVVAHYLNQTPQAQILFSDEDKISPDGSRRYQAYFKGAFDPFLLFGHNMVSHLGVYRRDLIQSIGGFRLGLEGSQDYDLMLRAMEAAPEDAVVHIPHVLYHWRAIPGSTAVSADQKSYAILAAQAAINAHFSRTDMPLLSVPGFAAGNTAVVRTRNFDTPISIIIPTRNGLADLRACFDSIVKRDHRAVEILIVDNGSDDPETLKWMSRTEARGLARIIRHPGEFNFSEINNRAAAEATGEILLFLNNDTEVLSADWLDRARALLSLPDVGMVGAKLLYPDGTLQHFGVNLGTADHRVASHAHLGLGRNDPGYFSKARLLQQFSAVTAACMFVRREVFEAVGGFDPQLRIAYNDVDLCLKVRRAGYKIVADPEIELIHKESRSRGSDTSPDKRARLDEEAAEMRVRWGPTLDADPFYSPNHSLDGNLRLADPPRVPMPWFAWRE